MNRQRYPSKIIVLYLVITCLTGVAQEIIWKNSEKISQHLKDDRILAGNFDEIRIYKAKEKNFLSWKELQGESPLYVVTDKDQVSEFCIKIQRGRVAGRSFKMLSPNKFKGSDYFHILFLRKDSGEYGYLKVVSADNSVATVFSNDGSGSTYQDPLIMKMLLVGN